MIASVRSVITRGPTAPLAGEPRAIAGIGRERLVYAAAAGVLTVRCDIGDQVTTGETVATIDQGPIRAPIAGTLRGMLRHGIAVEVKDKLCEVDPRPPERAVYTCLGQRPRAIAAGVLAALGRLADG